MNIIASQIISSSIKWIVSVLMIEEEALENQEILLIIAIGEQYSCYAQYLCLEHITRLS